ncbi:MAG TPA: BTAD domain-containing putative transcriptional regulator [Fimbriimonas sp.]|nr:BTAD domain-containing putative transcriptional regulator [Fimbriimonas sp.]
MAEAVRVAVIGDFHAALPDGRPAEFRSRRAAEVIARLSLEASRRILRSDLAAEIWPDVERPVRLNNLRPALTYARAGLQNADAIRSNEDWLVLSDEVDCDWTNLSRLETRVRRAQADDDRLVLLYSLDRLIQKPLLHGWDCHWLDPFRNFHSQRRLDSLSQLCEELALRGDWSAALGYAAQMRELDPTSEAAIRLQLRFLAELDRTQEAQREFSSYSRSLQLSLGLPVSQGLKRFAEEILAGRYRKSGPQSRTAVQKEIIADILLTLADEEPQRLLPLLSSHKLNWAIVFHATDLRPILERTLEATDGWSVERGGLAKRLLQVYSQCGDWQSLLRLANQLLASEGPTDRIAALNFLAMERRAGLDYPKALEYYDRAEKLAVDAGEGYLAAVTLANRGILNADFELYQLALKELLAAKEGLQERSEPNALYSISLVMAKIVSTQFLLGDVRAAEEAARSWRIFAETRGTLPYDAVGKALFGMVGAVMDDRSCREWLLSAIDTTFLTRHETALFDVAFPVVLSLHALGSRSEAARVARDLKQIAKARRLAMLPASKRLIADLDDCGSPQEPISNLSDLLAYSRERLMAI